MFFVNGLPKRRILFSNSHPLPILSPFLFYYISRKVDLTFLPNRSLYRRPADLFLPLKYTGQIFSPKTVFPFPQDFIASPFEQISSPEPLTSFRKGFSFLTSRFCPFPRIPPSSAVPFSSLFAGGRPPLCPLPLLAFFDFHLVPNFLAFCGACHRLLIVGFWVLLLPPPHVLFTLFCLFSPRHFLS